MMHRSKLSLAFAALATGSALGACSIATPFQGRIGQAPAEQHEEPVVVAITHARLGSNLAANVDLREKIGRVVKPAEHQPGYFGHALRRTLLGDETWTINVWQDEKSLMAFVRSDARQRAVREGAGALAEVRFARVSVECTALPLGWDRAEKLLTATAAEPAVLR